MKWVVVVVEKWNVWKLKLKVELNGEKEREKGEGRNVAQKAVENIN